MTTTAGTPPAALVAVSRTVVAAAAELVAGVERAVVGDANIRTAQRNAWDAIQADRARARAREEMNQLVAALLANGPRNQGPVSAAPSSTTQPDLVSTGAATR
jgi:hypothetical protein